MSDHLSVHKLLQIQRFCQTEKPVTTGTPEVGNEAASSGYAIFQTGFMKVTLKEPYLCCPSTGLQCFSFNNSIILDIGIFYF